MNTRIPIYYKKTASRRKPIHIPHNRRSSQFNPEFLDVNSLLRKFTPLIQSLHKYFCSYCGILDQPTDCEDLYSHIQFEFLRLCQKYDPRRGVDFTGYIQFNLRHRVYYYVCKIQKYQTTEQLLKQVEDTTLPLDMVTAAPLLQLEDLSIERELSKIEALASIPWKEITDELDKQIIQYILVNHSSLEELSKQKNISLRILKNKFNALCNKLISLHREN